MTIKLELIFNRDTILLLLKAYGWTIAITFFALLIGVIIGTLLAICKVLPKTNVITKILSAFADVYLTVIRGTPLLVQLMIIYFVIFGSVVFFNRSISPYIIAILGFGMNSGAYVAEIIRGGIMSVDSGQMEAGRSLGLGYGTTMKSIIIPQSMKNILPPLGNEAIMLVKETSVALIIGVNEFFTTIKGIVSASYNVMTPYLFAALVYLLTVLVMSLLLKRFERRLRRSDRRS